MENIRKLLQFNESYFNINREEENKIKRGMILNLLSPLPAGLPQQFTKSAGKGIIT